MQIYLDHHRSGDRGETSMPYQDFRQFLDVLRQHGELIDVNRPIALNDVGKAMKQSYVRQGPQTISPCNPQPPRARPPVAFFFACPTPFLVPF